MSNKKKNTTYFTCSTTKHSHEKNSKIPKIITENEVVDLPVIFVQLINVKCFIYEGNGNINSNYLLY